VSGAHLVENPDGSIHYKKGLTPVVISVPRVELSAPPGDQPLFLFGLGAGEILSHCLASFPSHRILAWDRDPTTLRLTLSRVEVVGALGSGRLRLLLGSDLLEALPELEGYTLVRHPVLWAVYGEELFLLNHPLGERRAVVCEGGLFVTELTLELQSRDISVYPMSLARLATEEQRLLLERVKPGVVAAINYTPGLSELCADTGRKLIFWEIDPSVHDRSRPLRDTAHTHAFTFREPYVAELRAMGFRNVEQLPLAADPNLRKPVQLTAEVVARYGATVSFVGTSLVEDVPAWEAAFLRRYCARKGEAARAEGARSLEAALAEQRKDLSRNHLPELLSSGVGAWKGDDLEWLVRCASEIASAERRVIYVSKLARFGIQAWGDRGWRATAAAGVNYRGPAGNFTDLNSIYCASRINLDVGRLHQLDIVTMRNFDILACGGFVLAERSADLEKLFVIDQEIACYATLEELEQKVAHYLTHPDEAREIAAAGRKAVLERHTIAQRVSHMLERAGVAD
jgi:spore maturation protein CgeB